MPDELFDYFDDGVSKELENIKNELKEMREEHLISMERLIEAVHNLRLN